MKNSLIHELMGRVYETRFRNTYKEELMKGPYFRRMDERLLEKIVNLDSYDFNCYLSLLYEIYKKNNDIMMYYDKLIELTKLMLPKLGSVNENALADILASTAMINKDYIVDFARILLNIKEINKVDAIVDMVYNQEIKERNFDMIMKYLIYYNNDISKEFIIGLLNNMKIVTNEFELRAALDFFDKTQEESKFVAFYKLFVLGELKDISLYSEYGMLIKDSLLKANNQGQLNTIVKLGVELKKSRFKNSIIKQILKCNNKYALEEYQELVKIPNILNKNNIIEIMEKLDKIKDSIQGSIITGLVKINPSNILNLIDEVTKKQGIRMVYPLDYVKKIKNNVLILNDIDLFRIVLDIKEPYKFEFLMKVLDYQDLLSNKNNREVIKDFFSVKEEYKYVAFYKYIEDNIQDKEFRLDSNKARNIIMLIKNAKKDFQVKSLVRISKLTEGSKYQDNLLIKAAYINYEAVGILLGDLLETKIMDDARFLDILRNFETCDNLCGQIGMVELAKNMKLRKSKFFIGYFMIMKRFIKINQVGILLNILDEDLDLDEYQLFKYCEQLMFVTNTKLLRMLQKLIVNNKRLDKETLDLCIMNVNNNSTFENIRFIREYLKASGKEDILGESEIDSQEVMYMLDRQKALDLNPNSVLVYKKKRSSEDE